MLALEVAGRSTPTSAHRRVGAANCRRRPARPPGLHPPPAAPAPARRHPDRGPVVPARGPARCGRRSGLPRARRRAGQCRLRCALERPEQALGPLGRVPFGELYQRPLHHRAGVPGRAPAPGRGGTAARPCQGGRVADADRSSSASPEEAARAPLGLHDPAPTGSTARPNAPGAYQRPGELIRQVGLEPGTPQRPSRRRSCRAGDELVAS